MRNYASTRITGNQLIQYIFGILSLVIFYIPNAYSITESPDGDSLLYYKIGGGRHITIPPSLTITTINLSASANWKAFSCNAFDPVISIEQSLDNLASGVDDAINAIESAVSAAIASLPGYLLQKANPGLYDLFQNGLLRANESFSLATKSCERMQSDIANNINPYADWMTMSWGDSWKTSIGAGEQNIHNAAEDAKDANNDGVIWIGGIKRGGEDQQPIRVLSEVASAGLNILSSRPAETESDLPNSAPLKTSFTGPNELSQWINNVLGEVEISICNSCQSGKQPGKGLVPHMERTAEDIAIALYDLVAEIKQPTRSNLEEVSAPGIAITVQVIQALKQLKGREQGILINKIGQDVARGKVIDQSLLVRRLLLTGIKEGNVSGSKMANTEVLIAIEELDKEIKLLTYEMNVRKELISDTIVQLLIRHKATNEMSIHTPALPPQDNRPLQNGEVKQ